MKSNCCGKSILSFNLSSIFMLGLSLISLSIFSSVVCADETIITHEYSYEVIDPVIVEPNVTTESVPMIVEKETIISEGEGDAAPVVTTKRTTEIIEAPAIIEKSSINMIQPVVVEEERVTLSEPETTTVVQEQIFSTQTAEPVVTTTEVTQTNAETGETITTTTVREESAHIESIKIDPASVDIQVVGIQTIEGGSVCGSEPLSGTVVRVTNNGTTNSFNQTGVSYNLCVTGSHNELNLGQSNNLDTIYITGDENLINVASHSSVANIVFLGDRNMVFLSTGINPTVDKKGSGNKVVQPQQRR